MPDRVLLDCLEFSKRHPCFTEGSLRKIIFESKPRLNSKGEMIPGNGFDRAIKNRTSKFAEAAGPYRRGRIFRCH